LAKNGYGFRSLQRLMTSKSAIRRSEIIKAAVKQVIRQFVNLFGKTAAGRYLFWQIIDNSMDRIQETEHRGVKFVFSVPNALNRYRIDTFSKKEPETLEWIDRFPQGSVVWDVGANIGLYSCYAAKMRGCRVFAFEPSVFNLELLARNIFLNQLTDLITIIPLPLSAELAVNKFRMTTTQWGGALSTFGQSYGHDGAPIAKVFEFPTIGLSMVDAVTLLRIPQPDYIKMDVDGIEHLVLKGGLSVLRAVKEVSIEINDQFTTQAVDARKYLEEAGLSFKEKKHADCFDLHTGSTKYTFNQIWIR
jgi:FkbM family methyltransferase